MNPKILFRGAILADAIAFAFLAGLLLVLRPGLPELLRQYKEAEALRPPKALEWVSMAASLPLLLSLVVSYFGLFFFKPWARVLYTLAILLMILSSIFDPPLGPLGAPECALPGLRPPFRAADRADVVLRRGPAVQTSDS